MMIDEVRNTVGRRVRFRVGDQDYIGDVEDTQTDCVILMTGPNNNKTRVVLHIDSIDAILAYVN